jgi:hypothetical protein
VFLPVRTSHPATGVEHSLYCSFFWEGERNLVVAGANLLRVFQLVPDPSIKVSNICHCQLFLICHCQLFQFATASFFNLPLLAFSICHCQLYICFFDFLNFIYCFICHPSDLTLSKDAMIEPRTVATEALAARRSNHSVARSHLFSRQS